MSDDLVKRLERENNDMAVHFDGFVKRIEDLQERNAIMTDRIEKLEAALRFYACDCKPDCGCGIEYYDGGAYCGHTAREALEGKDE
jgi:hypothetical protein